MEQYGNVVTVILAAFQRSKRPESAIGQHNLVTLSIMILIKSGERIVGIINITMASNLSFIRFQR